MDLLTNLRVKEEVVKEMEEDGEEALPTGEVTPDPGILPPEKHY